MDDSEQPERFNMESLVDPCDTVTFPDKKHMALGNLIKTDNLIEIVQLKGNFWRLAGFSMHGKNYLYPEEALFLVERSLLFITVDNQIITYSQFYNYVTDVISLSCYLTYVRLKALDYVVFRHDKTVKSFNGDTDLFDFLQTHPSHSLLDSLVSFDLYLHVNQFSKALIKAGELKVISHVVVMNSEDSFSSRVMLQLLKEANKVPVIFAVKSNTGFILLEEFTDALTSLSWENTQKATISIEPLLQRRFSVGEVEESECEDEEEEGGVVIEDLPAVTAPGGFGRINASCSSLYDPFDCSVTDALMALEHSGQQHLVGCGGCVDDGCDCLNDSGDIIVVEDGPDDEDIDFEMLESFCADHTR